jgi:hypothetical protein
MIGLIQIVILKSGCFYTILIYHFRTWTNDGDLGGITVSVGKHVALRTIKIDVRVRNRLSYDHNISEHQPAAITNLLHEHEHEHERDERKVENSNTAGLRRTTWTCGTMQMGTMNCLFGPRTIAHGCLSVRWASNPSILGPGVVLEYCLLLISWCHCACTRYIWPLFD